MSEARRQEAGGQSPPSAAARRQEPLLAVERLGVQYGAIRAVDQVSFHVDEGELVALVGANGAGKSSTLRAIARLIDVSGGDVRVLGESVLGLAAHELPRRGVVLVPEGRRVFGEMSVVDNLRIGAYTRPRAEAVEDLRRVYALFPILEARQTQPAGTLSGGEQQMLAIGRALMARPRLLLLDEPSLGLAPTIVRQVFELLRRLHADGVTILLVEQNARLALETADRAYVLQTGQIVAEGPARELADSDEIRRRYLGVATATPG